ncbi:MAG: nuclear transport factor 2 family protein [Verrucomicrobia bacterium]|nr:nuclear transport factor 2 family protein [Verrucomicrobiota bacterium]
MKAVFTTLIAITVLAFAASVHAQDSSGDADATKAKLKQMEDTWEKAFVDKNTGTMESMIADDYAGVSSKGERQNKSQLLDEMKSDTDTFSSATNDNMEVHLYGSDVATVVGISTEKGKDKDGKEFTRRFGWVDTWMQRDGNWQCIGEGVAPLPENK